MRRLYLFLTIVGFIAPNVFVFIETMETGNVLLWANPAATLQGMFANTISTAFVVDLLLVVLVFFIWSLSEASKYHIKYVGFIWLFTLFFGLAGAFPLFLYIREKKKGNVTIDGKSKYGYTRVS